MSDADDLRNALKLGNVTGISTAAMERLARLKAESEAKRAAIYAKNERRLDKNSGVLIEEALKVANATRRLQQGMIDADAEDTMQVIKDIEGYYDAFRPGKAAPERRAETPDEVEVVPVATQPAPVLDAPPLKTPRPLNCSSFLALRDEYVRFFLRAETRPSKLAYVRRQTEKALAQKARYEAVGAPHGIPWWFIAGIHMMESNFDFDSHLHNGDPLTDRTRRHPAGRPVSRKPPYTWEDSAADALTGTDYIGFAGQSDWSLPRALWRWEKYNGFGYRDDYVPTPYLWGHTTIYRQGRYTSDGEFEAGATSAQCGVVAFLKELQARGEVSLEIEAPAPDDGDAPADPGPLIARPILATQNDFTAFFAQALPDIRNFSAAEFLYRGGSDAEWKLNSDPPRELWPNIIQTARLLQAFRDRLTARYPGAKVRLISIYRNEAYNRQVGGALTSRHMAFNAADFQAFGVPAGGPGDWAGIIGALHGENADFIGGLKAYPTFVHVDTRGAPASW